MEMSPKKTGNKLFCSLLRYLSQKIAADAECAPWAAARDTAPRAVKLLTSCQILPEPLDIWTGPILQWGASGV